MTTTSIITKSFSSAFCSTPSLTTRNNVRIQLKPIICMRTGKKPSGKKRKPSASSKLSAESQARIEEKARALGIRKPQPGDMLDEKYNNPQNQSQSSPTIYQRLASIFGIETLEIFEKGLYVSLTLGLTFFLLGGLAISSEAFFKATGNEIPQGLDPIIAQLQQLFTPTLFIFVALSSILGLYKQSQLSSGVTSYTELENNQSSDDS